MTFSNTAILGLQWGDEGKGKIVNYLAGNFSAACRYQGGHNAGHTLIVDGKIVSAAQEERFSRVKHDARYPKNAINFILESNSLRLNDIDFIVFFEKPFLKFERLLETYLAFAPRGFKSFSLSMPIWLREKLFQKKFLFD